MRTVEQIKKKRGQVGTTLLSVKFESNDRLTCEELCIKFWLSSKNFINVYERKLNKLNVSNACVAPMLKLRNFKKFKIQTLTIFFLYLMKLRFFWAPNIFYRHFIFQKKKKKILGKFQLSIKKFKIFIKFDRVGNNHIKSFFENCWKILAFDLYNTPIIFTLPSETTPELCKIDLYNQWKSSLSYFLESEKYYKLMSINEAFLLFIRLSEDKLEYFFFVKTNIDGFIGGKNNIGNLEFYLTRFQTSGFVGFFTISKKLKCNYQKLKTAVDNVLNRRVTRFEWYSKI
ncbi:hypothetical protein AGLY_012598 [Aphis glycines]|uniref:Uncharacterized protein n=1 Tax=Aphis glycines TaxID=307491 RepID=A0A6G0T9P8_APHGL|nr:hypothetical protein AGLY_012598 [Aphis glycines]